MNNKTFLLIIAIIFSVIAVLHLCRVIYRWEAVIGGLVLPLWISEVAIVVAGYLAVLAFRFWRS